jgi:hypothetical protein
VLYTGKIIENYKDMDPVIIEERIAKAINEIKELCNKIIGALV